VRDPFASKDSDGPITVLFLLVAKCAWGVVMFWVTLTKWAVLFPLVSVPTLTTIAALVMSGPWAAVFLASVWASIFVVWAALDARSFVRFFARPIASRWHAWHTYRVKWARVCALHGLAPVLDTEPVVPKLRRIHVGQSADELHVNLVFGQTVADWSSRSEALAHAFGAQSSTVLLDGPGRVRIVLRRIDGLRNALALPSPAETVDLANLVIGAGENGTPWSVRLLGRHILVAGLMGAGKGSVVWSMLAALAPAIRDSSVQAWVIDPKGGMEFGQGVGLFTRFAYDTGTESLELLRDAAAVLTRRANGLRGTSRQHEPTPTDPFIVIVIDELASLIAYQTDRKLANEISGLLSLILSQGRAVGVSVVAAVQDPSKDVVLMRQLFPIRIGLRFAEATQVDMILGQGSRVAGALCDQIPDALPGVAYVMEDGHAAPLRARAFHVTDADIAHLAITYAPNAEPVAGVQFIDAATGEADPGELDADASPEAGAA